MTEFNSDEVDWRTVEQKMAQANNALREAEEEISSGFDEEAPLGTLAGRTDDLPREIDELIRGLTSSSSYLRNGTMNYIP